MTLPGQQFQFFYEKNLSVKKAPIRKTKDFTPPRHFCARIITAFVVFCLLNFILLVGFGLVYVFVHSKSFCKKKTGLKLS